MSFFSRLNGLAHGKGSESVCRDVARQERSADYNPADHISSQTQGVMDEIDGLIAELQMRREEVLSESARIQREIVQLQAFSQSAVRSTKVGTTHLSLFKLSTKCISNLRKVADASALRGPHVKGISNEEHREDGVGALAQHDGTPEIKLSQLLATVNETAEAMKGAVAKSKLAIAPELDHEGLRANQDRRPTVACLNQGQAPPPVVPTGPRLAATQGQDSPQRDS
jgi:hypothetical protein